MNTHGIFKLSCSLVATFALLHCDGTSEHPQPSAPTEKPSTAAHELPHWSYSGDTGPSHWGDLDPSFALCKTGQKQAPVDIANNIETDHHLQPIVLSYSPITLRIINNGHTIEVKNIGASFMIIGSDTYDLVQFHFHSPSEHTVQGKHADMEMHLVHRNAGGNLAVIGLLLKKGEENKVLAPVWEHIPAEPSEAPTTISDITIDLKALLPAEAAYTTYDGSLTTPPCTEGVRWLLLSDTREVSEAQIKKFQEVTHGATDRPIQPLGGRHLTQFKP